MKKIIFSFILIIMGTIGHAQIKKDTQMAPMSAPPEEGGCTNCYRWNRDWDGDGYGDPSVSMDADEKPDRYVANQDDCNDSDSSQHPYTVWYFDNDGDGFGNSATTVVQCEQPYKYVRNASDYNDNNGAITNIAPQTFYKDFDKDTFGSPTQTVYCSVMPSGYVTNNADCNDGDITINPNTVWYSDRDKDGFGAGSGGTTLLSCTQPEGYVRNTGDCNDFDGEINPNTVWYHDGDHDNFGTGEGRRFGCAAPLDHDYVTKGGDCDDNNVNINPNTMWFRDGDGDSFGSNTNFIQSCTKPVGYVPESGDCDDGNKLIKPNNIWYYDNDGDGHGNISVTKLSCTKPEKYVDIADDCNDYDVTVYQVMTWYYDGDGDSFGDPKDFVSTCKQPYKHVLNNSDYDDSTGNITNIPPRTFYEDFDKDTFGNPNVSLYYSIQPTGYVTNASDYNDRTEFITNIPPQTFYEDFDKDTFGNPNVSLYYSLQPTGYVPNNADCDDRKGELNPNTKWYADNEGDGLGDPSSFVQQCTKPAGNYIDNNLDNCPQIQGTSSDCSVSGSTPLDYNYIITTTYQAPTATALVNPTPDKALANITYFDGLGRPIQQIANKQSVEGKDIITPIGYDDFGRQTKEYLPYAATSTNMAYEVNAVTNAINFYSTAKYENTANPFSEKKLESSPLNRVLKQAAPGAAWAMDGGHEIKIDYQTNTSNEVKLFKVATNWNATLGIFETPLSENGTYDVNELIKTVTYDENTSANPTEAGGSTVEFKDKEGKVVLKRTYESSIKHDTYYVYDSAGNLSYVIPPMAADNMNLSNIQNDITSTAVVNSGSTLQLTAKNSIVLLPGFNAKSGSVFNASIVATGNSQNTLDNLCYQYKYDYRNRLVEKKLPGKQWEFIVYDKLDRPVATGPANSPFKDDIAVGWLITKYDAFGRPVYTGWSNSTANASSRTSMQNAQNTATVLFETKQTSGAIDGIQAFYTNAVAPTNIKLLTVNYYDDYAFPNMGTAPTTIEGQPVLANAKGLATGSWIRALSLATVISGETTATFYDSKARPIGNYSQNHLSGYTSTDSKLDFSGKPIYTITKHKLMSNSTELTVKEEFTYSPQGRLLTHTHQINGGAIQLLADNTYDKLGQLTSKKVGNNSGMPLQKVDYSYNIRGWMTEINKTANLQQDTDPRDWFAFAINYNKPTTNTSVKPLYNGNIAETFWRSNSDGTFRSYGYQYDELNRLKKAIYQKPGENIPVSGAYNESLSYDKNGNILSLQRFGGSDAPSIIFQIDDLTYDYSNVNSNQLTKVTDGPMGNDNQGFIDGNKTGDDYSYDANGNMITDKNKNITGIVYNHLNLPVKITFGTGNFINYIYSGSGQKLEKKVTDNGIITQTNYLGGYQYKDNVLQFFPTAEGYVEPNGSSFKYVFQYKDHLGNVRLSYSDADKNGTITNNEIIEESNYYPFGLKHSGYNSVVTSTNPAQKYKYNGKELQDELGLNMYDYGARNYDPALGRWMNIDPMAEKYFGATPYNYVLNSPVNSIDPDGMDVYLLTESGRTILALKEKDKKTDTMYAVNNSSITDISSSSGTKETTSIFDMKDTNGDGQFTKEDGVTVKSGLIGQLGKASNEGDGSYLSTSDYTKENEDNYLSLFKYISDNSLESEFSLHFFRDGGKSKIQLGTYYENAVSPGVSNNGKIKSYHNHSDTDLIDERMSMGDNGHNRPDYSHQKNDFNKANSAQISYPNYVYFGKSHRLYNVTKESINYIGKINKSNNLKVKR